MASEALSVGSAGIWIGGPKIAGPRRILLQEHFSLLGQEAKL